MTRSGLLAMSVELAAMVAMPVSSWADSNSQGNRQQNSSQQQNSPEARNGDQHANSQNAPEGYVIFEEDAVYLMANEPQNHFVRALEDLSQNKTKNAAAEMNIAADYLHTLASTKGSSDAQDLRNAANGLREKAKDVEAGKVNDPKQLSAAFSEAEGALAKHFDDEAASALKSNHEVRAGHELEASATSYREALSWSNQKPDQKAYSTIHEAMATGSRLVTSNEANVQKEGKGTSLQNGQQSNDSHMSQGSGANAQASSSRSPEQVAQDLGNCIGSLQGQTASER